MCVKYTRVQRGKFTDVELLSDRIFVEIEIFVRILLIGRLIGENEERIKYIRLCVLLLDGNWNFYEHNFRVWNI